MAVGGDAAHAQALDLAVVLHVAAKVGHGSARLAGLYKDEP